MMGIFSLKEISEKYSLKYYTLSNHRTKHLLSNFAHQAKRMLYASMEKKLTANNVGELGKLYDIVREIENDSLVFTSDEIQKRINQILDYIDNETKINKRNLKIEIQKTFKPDTEIKMSLGDAINEYLDGNDELIEG